MADPAARPDNAAAQWQALFLLTFASAILYVFLEWLFFRTKVSFMDTLALPATLELLSTAAAVLAGISLLILGGLWLLSRLPALVHYQYRLLQAGVLLPMFILATLGLLLVDNFIYTMLSAGIVGSVGWLRVGFLGLYITLLVYVYASMLRALPGWARRLAGWRFSRLLQPCCLAMILLSMGVALANAGASAGPAGPIQIQGPLPNILILTGDGINARNTSLYGYGRDTTPHLNTLGQDSLVAENAFTNAASTSGSIVAMFTSKPPARTRVLYPPNILRTQDAEQHLPAILRGLGYHTVQISERFYVDAYQLNVMNGFDEVNGRSFENSWLIAALGPYISHESTHFLFELDNRAFERLEHIFFVKTIKNVYTVINGRVQFSDLQRAEEVVRVIEANQNRPLFMHVHFMGTHGGFFTVQKQVFSAGKDQETQTPWDTDFYDDSILEFDQAIGQIITALKEKGLYERTILVIGSDHAQQWAPDERIPLLFHFPADAHAGRIQANAQYIDIAPTLLDALHAAQPAWMEGVSLIQPDIPNRPIFTAIPPDRVQDERGRWELPDTAFSPPYYQFGSLQMILCDRWFKLNLTAFVLTEGKVKGSTAPAAACQDMSRRQVVDIFTQYMQANGFDASPVLAHLPNLAP